MKSKQDSSEASNGLRKQKDNSKDGRVVKERMYYDIRRDLSAVRIVASLLFCSSYAQQLARRRLATHALDVHHREPAHCVGNLATPAAANPYRCLLADSWAGALALVLGAEGRDITSFRPRPCRRARGWTRSTFEGARRSKHMAVCKPLVSCSSATVPSVHAGRSQREHRTPSVRRTGSSLHHIRWILAGDNDPCCSGVVAHRIRSSETVAARIDAHNISR